jgi:primosomal protein N' (replication factor Y)
MTESGAAALLPDACGRRQKPRLTAAASTVLSRLSERPQGLTLATLRKDLPRPISVIVQTLIRRGFITEVRPVDKQPSRVSGQSIGQSLPLIPEERDVPSIRELPPSFTSGKAGYAAYLLQARSSVRTAIIIDAANLTLAGGRSVLIIAPEIVRTVALFEQIRAHCKVRAALWHGGLSPKARALLWRDIRAGGIGVVVGTRSAVFSPFTSLGLIYIDNEEDASLKEEQHPRYHARDVARVRARQHEAALVLGSSHPSVDTMAQPDMIGLCPGGRTVDTSFLPHIQALDIRSHPYGTLLSPPIIDGIRAALDRKESAVLFLNRKGFAPAIQCRDCGQALQCQNCSVALTFYRRAGVLICHYCGSSHAVPDMCPTCQAVRLEPSGSGTERLEEEVRRQFRNTRIIRLDSENAGTAAQAGPLRREIAEGRADIIIGTQMLLQGSPLPPAGFVGCPYADAGLHRPDFRAAEQTYHSLIEAVSLAKSAEDGGHAILQTYLPKHHVIAAVAGKAPELFYEHEMASRKALGYPPYTQLISLCVSGKDERLVKEAAKAWALELTTAIAQHRKEHGSAAVLGPIPAIVTRIRDRHRYQIMLKSPHGGAARDLVRASLPARGVVGRAQRGRSSVQFDVEVDPMSI